MWMISYERIRQGSSTAARFSQLWAYLDQGMWYEQILRGSKKCQGYDWLQEVAESEIGFERVIESFLGLLAY